MAILGIEGGAAAYAALILSAVALVVSLARTRSRRGAADAPPASEASRELVAVIAAAVAAASGMKLDGFRISSIRRADELGGFSTPIWGYADRISRTSYKS